MVYKHLFLHSTQDIADSVNRGASLRVFSVPKEDDEHDEGEDDDQQEGHDDGHHA